MRLSVLCASISLLKNPSQVLGGNFAHLIYKHLVANVFRGGKHNSVPVDDFACKAMANQKCQRKWRITSGLLFCKLHENPSDESALNLVGKK